MNFVEMIKNNTLALKMNEQYLPRFFIIEEGKRAFHERLHYWQHVGSTFGAFQIIGFHITAKAMRITIRDLIASGLMEVPVQEHTLERLYGRTKVGKKHPVLNFLRLLKRFEFAELTKPIHIKDLDYYARFHGGWHERQPLLKIKKDIGIPFAANHVKEIHASAISKLRCEEESLDIVETELWNRAEECFGEETSNWFALLCDWALMSPNPSDMTTKMVKAPFKPDADCPEWVSFLNKIMENDKNKIEFIQRSAGYQTFMFLGCWVCKTPTNSGFITCHVPRYSPSSEQMASHALLFLKVNFSIFILTSYCEFNGQNI